MTDIHNSHKKDGRIYAAIDLKSLRIRRMS